MNKRQKEVEFAKLADEQKVLDELKKHYETAAKDIAKNIKLQSGKINAMLKNWDDLDEKEKSILQSQIYQRGYQESLQKQIDGFIDALNSKQHTTVAAYLEECYKTGFVGSVYDLHGQKIPLVLPINQKQMIKAVTLNSKVSKKLYGVYVTSLKKHIKAEISRGVATGLAYADIARNLNNRATKITYNQAARIARTEGHGVQCQAASDAQHAAKAAGADVVKQWDAALDGRTRESHRMLDGEIRELDEPFSNGMKMPSDPAGGAAEVVNCRCALLQRARWALDDDELETLKQRAAYYGLDKTKDFDDFKGKYLKAQKDVDVKPDKDYNEPRMGELSVYGNKHSKAIQDFIKDSPEDVKAAWNDCAADFHVLDPKYRGKKAHYSPSEDGVLLNISAAAKGSRYQTPYQVVFHEYGHHMDYIFNKKYGTGEKYKAFSETYKGGIFGKKMKEEAEKAIQDFANNTMRLSAEEALAKAKRSAKMSLIGEDEVEYYAKRFMESDVKVTDEIRKKFCEHIKDNVPLIDRTDISDMFEPIMPKNLHHPFGVGHGYDYWKNRDNGKEAFAEMYSAMVNNKGSLEQIKKYFPESYKIFIEMLKVVKK